MRDVRFWGVLATVLCSFSLPVEADQIKLALPVFSLESMPIFIAQDKGLFKKHGVEVDVITARGGGEAMKTFIAGDVQIVATGFPEVGLMRSRGVDVQLFFAQTTRVPFAVLGRKDLNLKSIADLKGKDIAVTSPGSLTTYITRYLITQQGWDPDREVSLVSVGGGGEILGALKGQKVSAATLFEPFVTVALHDNIANILVDVAESLDAFSSAPLSTSKAFVEKSSKEANAIFAALSEAVAYLHNDKAGAFELAKAKFPGTSPDTLKGALDRMYKVYSRDGKFTRANIQKTQEISKALKVIETIYRYEDVVAPMARE